MPRMIRLSFVLVVLLTLWVWQRVSVVRMVAATDRLQLQVAGKAELAEKIQAEIAELRQRARVAQIATDQLNLITARPSQLRHIAGLAGQVPENGNNNWDRVHNSFRRLSVAAVTDRK